MEAKKSKAKRKSYSEYPQLQFTTTPEIKKLINNRLEKLRKELNRDLSDGELLFSKSDIAIKALVIGLSKLEKIKNI